MHQMGRFLDLSKKPSPESASECVRGNNESMLARRITALRHGAGDQ
jgi:hypothetical protein